MTLDRLKRACAFVDAGATRGTAYLVAPDLAVTCEHVVRSAGQGGTVTLRFPTAPPRSARVERIDASIDCALLRLETPLPGVEPLTFAGRLTPKAHWDAYGYPAVNGEAGLLLSGVVQDPHGEDSRRIPAVVLWSHEVAAGAGGRLQGWSGSPVVVDGYVIGHLRRVIPDNDDPSRAQLGVVYASSASNVAAFLGDLLPPPAHAVQPPHVAYDKDWYVPRGAQERDALNHLHAAGAPAVLWAPELFGKTWLLKRLLEQLRNDRERPATVVAINPDLIDRPSWESFPLFLHEIARRIVEGVGGQLEWLHDAWVRPGGPIASLTWLMEEHVLKGRKDRLVVAIDRADAVLDRPFQDEFFGLLRGWASSGEDPWRALRMILTVSTTPTLLNRKPDRSPFNLTTPISLGDLGEPQVRQLSSWYRLGWGDDELEQLREIVGGHPYLVRLVMYTAVIDRHEAIEQNRAPTPFTDLLADADGNLFGEYLNRYRARLTRQPDLLATFRKVARNLRARPDIEISDRLQRAGLVVRPTGHGYKLRYKLYERLL